MEEKKQHRAGHRTKGISYKQTALNAAKDLCYGPEVMQAIIDAKTNTEIERIMINARRNQK